MYALAVREFNLKILSLRSFLPLDLVFGSSFEVSASNFNADVVLLVEYLNV